MRPRQRPFRLLRQIVFLGLCLVAVYLPLTPLAPGSDRVTPDLLYCLAMAWVLRDPASAPLWIIAGAGLLADVLMARPLGLGALMLVLASEVARSRRQAIMGSNILVEWGIVLALFCLAWFALLAVLRLSFSASPDLDTTLRYLAETAFLYPVISLATMLGGRMFGPRRAPRDPFERRRAW
jgi:rod shape-determining protein MreD